MKAVQVAGFDGPDGLRVVDVPEPEAEMVLDVHAAGISFPDLLLSRGEYQVQPDPPFTLGTEAAGVVRSVPEGCGLAVGDRVAAFVFGAFAEAAAATPVTAFRLPDSMSFEQGAGFVMNYHTAHFGLVRRAGLRDGERLLVHGAAGGVGTAAIQVGKALGAHVTGVVSSDEKEQVARAAGADEVLRSDADWRAGLDPVDVVYDPVGGSRLGESLRVLGQEGRLVVIGFAEGSIPEVKANRLLFRNVSLIGAAWGHFALERPDYMREVAEDIDRMARSGHVDPIVGRTYAMDEAGAALRDLDERRAVGKLVLKVR